MQNELFEMNVIIFVVFLLWIFALDFLTAIYTAQALDSTKGVIALIKLSVSHPYFIVCIVVPPKVTRTPAMPRIHTVLNAFSDNSYVFK